MNLALNNLVLFKAISNYLSIYGASDIFVYDLNSISCIRKKRSKSLVSNYRDYFDENFRKVKDELIQAKKVRFIIISFQTLF